MSASSYCCCCYFCVARTFCRSNSACRSFSTSFSLYAATFLFIWEIVVILSCSYISKTLRLYSSTFRNLSYIFCTTLASSSPHLCCRFSYCSKGWDAAAGFEIMRLESYSSFILSTRAFRSLALALSSALSF